MKIAILGWGSLIWKQLDLKIQNNEWFKDGPSLPIEFARVSKDKRLTLVIKPEVKPVIVLYSISSFTTLVEARENLRVRESTPNIENIGFIDFTNSNNLITRLNPEILHPLFEWNKTKNMEAIIWTDLGPNFKEKLDVDFNIENVNSYLNSLKGDDLKKAKEYIYNAPIQIQTDFRNDIEKNLS